MIFKPMYRNIIIFSSSALLYMAHDYLRYQRYINDKNELELKRNDILLNENEYKKERNK